MSTDINSNLIGLFKNFSNELTSSNNSFLNNPSSIEIGKYLISDETAKNNQTLKKYKEQLSLKKLLSLFTGMNNIETNNANKEVRKNEKNISKLANEESYTKNKLLTEIAAITAKIEAETLKVLDTSKEIENTNEKLAEKQAEINEINEQIKKEQEALANAKDGKEQARILSNIQNLSSRISVSLEEIESLKANFEKSSEEVLNANKNIETSKQISTTIHQENEAKLAQFAQVANNLIKTTTQSQFKGQTNAITGEVAEKAAKASSITVATEVSAGRKLRQVATDHKSAGKIRTQGSLTGLNNLMQGIGNIRDSLSILAEFKTSVGSSLENFDTHFGNWESKIEPTITSFGSFEKISVGNEELQGTIATDLQSLNATNTEASQQTRPKEVVVAKPQPTNTQTTAQLPNASQITRTNNVQNSQPQENVNNSNLQTLGFSVDEKLGFEEK